MKKTLLTRVLKKLIIKRIPYSKNYYDVEPSEFYFQKLGWLKDKTGELCEVFLLWTRESQKRNQKKFNPKLEFALHFIRIHTNGLVELSQELSKPWDNIKHYKTINEVIKNMESFMTYKT